MKNSKDNIRKSAPIPLNEAIDDMFDAFHLKQQVDESTIIAMWEELMGKTIASRTTKLFFKDKKLIVELSSAPLKQELIFSKEKILALFSDKIGNSVVDDVVFL